MKLRVKMLSVICLLQVFFCTAEYSADLVVFSYDRPLQLYALLESVNRFVTGLAQIEVIYRASDDSYAVAYEEVYKTFPTIVLTKQGDNPRQDFKPLTLNALLHAPSDYILFAVDDIVVKEYVDLTECARVLEQAGAYGFYLRLGKHLSECYTMQRAQMVPSLIELGYGICAWQFKSGQYDWRYPNTVDMTVYRKKDIEHDLKTMTYHSPNSLEAQWNARARSLYSRVGLCYERTKIVNLPLNVVSEFKNRHMNLFKSDELLASFNDELKMDIEPLFGIENKGAHMEYVPSFVTRDH